jgi:signal transduction histidine kinase
MWPYLQSLLDSSTLSPHGICLLWRPELIWLHVVSDAFIALAYFSIPFVLAIFVSKRPDVQFGWVFWAFAVFITACGTTHLMSIWTLWIPDYAFEGAIKAATAIASVVTAIGLWPLLPKALAIPSPAQLREVNAVLEVQIAERRAAVLALEHAIEERCKIQEMLRQSQKMEVVGQLTGGIAHDFNNLLTVIIISLEIAQRTLSSWVDGAQDRLGHVVANAMGGAQRAATLTQRLLAFARRQPLDPKPLNSNVLLTDLSALLHRALGESVGLEVIAAAELWEIEVDPGQLEAAILNLVVNARDALPSSGMLTIETRNVCLDHEYCRAHAEIEPGQYVLIAVSDNGTGMSEDVINRAFEPFFTTKEPGQGTGLGLSQVYGFVRQSGGHVKIDSELGKGTTVRIYLPRLCGEVDHVEPTAAKVVGGHFGETILVVEDDAAVRAQVVNALRELRYQVLDTGDAKSALTLLDRLKQRIDLLLTDVILPGMNGRQLADEVKKCQPTAAVLFMTGYSRNTIVHQGRLDPGVELIQKPLTQHALAAKIRDLLDVAATKRRMLTA